MKPVHTASVRLALALKSSAGTFSSVSPIKILAEMTSTFTILPARPPARTTSMTIMCKALTPNPVTGTDFTGTGMTTDGSGDGDFNKMTAFVDAHHNTFVSTCNAAMNNSSSHDVNFHDNRMVTSSFLPDGTRVDNSPGACTGCVNNTFLPSPITSATEKNEWILWPQKVAGNGIWVGTTGSFNNDTQAAPLGINPFWPALPSGSMNPAPTLNVLSGGTWRKVHRRAGSFRRQEVDGL